MRRLWLLFLLLPLLLGANYLNQTGSYDALGGGSGSVTSVATTSPITGGTITSTGTIACATCTTNASALTSNLPVIGAGSNATAVGTRSGNTTSFATTSGTLTSGNLTKFDASGNVVDAGSPGSAFAATTYWTTGIPYSSQALSAASSQQLKLYAVYLPIGLTFTNITIEVVAADASTKYDWCLYDTAGGFGGTSTLKADVSTDGSNGLVFSSNGVNDKATRQGSQTITPGWYIFAYVGSAVGTATIRSDSTHFPAVPFTGGTTISGGTAGGACPSTITAPAASWSTSTGKVVFAMHN